MYQGYITMPILAGKMDSHKQSSDFDLTKLQQFFYIGNDTSPASRLPELNSLRNAFPFAPGHRRLAFHRIDGSHDEIGFLGVSSTYVNFHISNPTSPRLVKRSQPIFQNFNDADEQDVKFKIQL